MEPQDSQMRVIGKVALATILIGGLIFYVAKSAGTMASNGTILFYMFLGLILTASYIVIYAYIGGSFRQWILRKGGIDNQWLWFKHNPPGFESEKKQYLEKAKDQ